MKKTVPDKIHLASRSSLPMYRSINSIDILARYAAGRGIDAEKLLAVSGIKPKDLRDWRTFCAERGEIRISEA